MPVAIALITALSFAQNAAVITNIEWVRRPDPAATAQFMPPIASFLEIEGSATVMCTAVVEGLPKIAGRS